MRRFWWVLAALLLGSGAVAFVVGHRRQPEWTTSSQEALREFRKGLEAEMKYYQDEALEHYRAASELDPEFAMAKLKSLQWTKRDGDGKETIARLGDELRKFDLDRLNERERFLLSYRIARLDKENAKAEKLLTAYLAGHPEDPWALSIRCAQAWDRQDWPTVERCDRKLLTADPNWVRAQNDLGYIAMAQGRFEDAEEMFRTYLFVAPDQPNPHDSLGELLTLRGRYDEAAQQFEEALRIRPDFCASWAHWLLSAQLAGDDGQAEEVMRRAQEAGTCDASYLQQHRCALDIWVPLAKGDAAAAYEAGIRPECNKRNGDLVVPLYLSALASGHGEEADQLLGDLKHTIAGEARENPFTQAALEFLEGARLSAAGDHDQALHHLQAADEKFVYWGDGQGIFKLQNRLAIAALLEKAGDSAGAAKMRDDVRQVNPRLAARFANQPMLPGL
jgi:tetratricopeptide (TPR) repeat protein